MSVALVLGGGAPTLTLESGALAALDDCGVEFSVISTAGAGMVVGLIYAAPRGKPRRQALADTTHLGVHDSIYSSFPINFKVFHKPGALADQYRDFLKNLYPHIPFGGSPAERFARDWLELMASAFCPTSLTMTDLGMCAPAPWIEDVVDFERLRAFPGEFYMNAYNVTDQRMETFSKPEITPDHFRAALAFPFLYPPYEMNGKFYIEGSAIDTLGLDGLLEYRDARARRDAERDPDGGNLPPITTVVVCDVLSARRIIRRPKNLYDAWIQSIMVPLVRIAEDDLELFQYRHNRRWKLNLLKIQFDVPEDHWPNVLDWSHSNLSTLYEVGYEAGMAFYEQHERLLQPRGARRPPAKLP